MKKGLIGMFLSAALTVGFALAASDVELFDREILSNSRNFTVHEGKFTPAGPDRAAVMEFPTGKWSALYRKQALPALPAGEEVEFVFAVKARMDGDPKQFKSTTLHVYFYDRENRPIKSEPVKSVFFKANNELQSLQLVGKLPVGCAVIRTEINSHGGVSMQIEDASLTLRSDRISPEALFGVVRAGNAELRHTNFWKPYDSVFTPAAEGKNALLAFPAGKWSALIGTLMLDPKFRGAVSVTMECRWSGDFSAAKHTSLSLMFSDADRVKLTPPAGTKADQSVRKTGEWQTLTVDSPVPDGAAQLRIDVSSHGGGTLEIRSLEVRLRGVDLTEAAVTGLTFPGLMLPGRAAASQAEVDRAEVECFKSVPFDFDAPFWAGRPEYPIPNTKAGKSALQPGDNRAFFRLASDGRELFVRFRAEDDALNFRGENLYERDCFEFFLMPTGRYRNERSRIRQEQYTVSRDESGKTASDVPAQTRLIPGGWEAMIRIPLQTETRRITPFNGLELTFNTVYQDSDTQPQEHYLSFSGKDQNNRSWSSPELYVPLLFVSAAPTAYAPLWLGDAAEYNVAANHPGRINLIEFEPVMKNLGFWGIFPEAEVSADGTKYTVKFPAHPTSDLRPLLPVFSVLPGEVLEFEYEAKVDSGSIPAPGVAFLSMSNWEQISFGHASGVNRVGTQWTRVPFRAKVPEKFRENLRSGRLLMNCGSHPGRTLEIRNFRLTRRLPVDFDAKISVRGAYSHLRVGEAGGVEFTFDLPAERQVKFTAEAKAFFGGETVLKEERELTLPAGRSEQHWELAALPAGFFNIVLKVRTPEGEFLADRELYVAKYIPAAEKNVRSGIWFHNSVDLTPPLDDAALVTELSRIGSGVVYFGDTDFFDSHGTQIPSNPLELAAAFKRAGFRVGSLLQRGNRLAKHAQLPQPGEMPEWFRSNLELAGKSVDFWNFSNEPNLQGGWMPAPDAREWAMFYRPFFNAVRRYAPESTVVLGNLNRMPVDYLANAHAENGLAFGQGVIGVHLYGYEFNGSGFETLLKARREYGRLYPGWQVWDTESGYVFHTFNLLSEAIAKKFPMHLSAGIETTIFYNDRDLMLPGADASPLVPIEAFKNRFYLDVEPVGFLTLGEGAVHVYLFRRPDGTGLAALWNTGAGRVQLELPGSAGAARFDWFGNRQPESKADYRLDLKNRHVHYFSGVDLDRLMREDSFVPSYRREPAVPRLVGPEIVQEVWLTPADVTRNFDHRLAAGAPKKVRMLFRNDGDSPVTVTPHSECGETISVTFPEPSFRLNAGEAREVVMTLEAAGEFAETALSVGGKIQDGRQLVPVIFRLEPASPVSVEGYSRSITVRNDSSRVSDIEVAPSLWRFFFLPDVVKLGSVNPGESRTVPLNVKRDGNHPQYVNSRQSYSIRTTWAGGEFETAGELWAFLPMPFGGTVDFGRLSRSVEQNGLRVDYDLFEAGGDFRIALRIHDRTPVQKRELGDIRDGGDVLLIALDDEDGYREYGFSIADGRRHSYLWRGRYGVETAIAADECIGTLERTGEWIDAELRIPRGSAKAGSGFSIKVIDCDDSGNRREVNLGSGILPRDAGKMGVLVK